jgi:hypothetical protein
MTTATAQRRAAAAINSGPGTNTPSVCHPQGYKGKGCCYEMEVEL